MVPGGPRRRAAGVAERKSWLFCAWLAWSRFRVVLLAPDLPAIRDKTLPTVIGCLDAAPRRFGGTPTDALTDNEKTVTLDHLAGIPVRHPQLVAAARHHGLTIASRVPADPRSKGGSAATVRIATADLVPTEANLQSAYASFGELRAACVAWCAEVNARPHRTTRSSGWTPSGSGSTRCRPSGVRRPSG